MPLYESEHVDVLHDLCEQFGADPISVGQHVYVIAVAESVLDAVAKRDAVPEHEPIVVPVGEPDNFTEWVDHADADVLAEHLAVRLEQLVYVSQRLLVLKPLYGLVEHLDRRLQSASAIAVDVSTGVTAAHRRVGPTV